LTMYSASTGSISPSMRSSTTVAGEFGDAGADPADWIRARDSAASAKKTTAQRRNLWNSISGRHYSKRRARTCEGSRDKLAQALAQDKAGEAPRRAESSATTASVIARHYALVLLGRFGAFCVTLVRRHDVQNILHPRIFDHFGESGIRFRGEEVLVSIIARKP
jgi:hypothetical protein